MWRSLLIEGMMVNNAKHKRDLGPERKTEFYSAKIDYREEVRKAFQKMEQPFFVTLSGSRSMGTEEWTDKVTEALRQVKGISVRVDIHRQQKDRSAHIAIYGLPKDKEEEVCKALYSLRREARGKKKHFLVVGCSLPYLFAHTDFSSSKVDT